MDKTQLTDEQIDAFANEGRRNPMGGIYATRVHEFARAIEAAVHTALARSDAAGAPIYQVRETRSTHRSWIDVGVESYSIKQGKKGWEARIVYPAPVAPAAAQMAELRNCATSQTGISAAPHAGATLMPPPGEDPMEPGQNTIEAANERLRAAYCVQQPLPVPDQMALVWRADIMHLMHDWIHKNTCFNEGIQRRKGATLTADDDQIIESWNQVCAERLKNWPDMVRRLFTLLAALPTEQRMSDAERAGVKA
ncbi:hypothetical protein AB3X91_24480 [Paraburkholderia sp. BR14263]|uniref:hypothetical protein n=1 Tax=unclassified Paraburkholderia TaxID=2615204 RepID=UPI0034CD8CD1